MFRQSGQEVAVRKRLTLEKGHRLSSSELSTAQNLRRVFGSSITNP